MPRFSVLIFALALATTTGAAAQAPPSKSSQKGCYNSQTCVSNCTKSGGHYCEVWCQNRASTQTPCK
jgi:hypothetical protein